MNEYKTALKNYSDETEEQKLKNILAKTDYAVIINELKEYIEKQRTVSKEDIEKANNREKKHTKIKWEEKIIQKKNRYSRLCKRNTIAFYRIKKEYG